MLLQRESGEIVTSSWLLRQVTWRRSSSQAQPSGQKAKVVGRRWKTKKRSRRHILGKILTPGDFSGKAASRSSRRVIFTKQNYWWPCLWSDSEAQESVRFTHWPAPLIKVKDWVSRFEQSRSAAHGFISGKNQVSSIQRGGRGRTEGWERER